MFKTRIRIDSLQSPVAIMDATADGKDEEKVIAEATRDPTYFLMVNFVVLKVNKQFLGFSICLSLRYLRLKIYSSGYNYPTC